MRKHWTSLAVFGMLLVAGGGSASAQVQGLANVDISAIKSLQLRTEADVYVCDATVVLSNSGAQGVKLRNADFAVSFRGGSDVVPFGSSGLEGEQLVLPAADGDTPTVVETTLAIKVGARDDETLGRLIQLFNFLGNPETPIVMVLDGNTEVGMQTDKGWIYQTGIKAELEFTPSIQREVLFK